MKTLIINNLSKKLFLSINVMVFNLSLCLIILPLNVCADEIKEEIIPLQEVTTGTLYFKVNEKYSPAVTQNSDYKLNINGLIASVLLTQTFKNLSADYVEAIYVYPLIDDASVSSMVMEIGERRVVGKIKEKQQAKTLYSRAKKQGKKVSLVSQQRPNIFTTKVANIAPGETIKISLKYLQSVKLTENTFSLRIPLTLTPRYIPSPKRALESTSLETLNQKKHHPILTKLNSHGWAINNSRVPDAEEITPYQTRTELYKNKEDKQQTVTINARLNGGLPIDNVLSLHHDIDTSTENDSFILSLTNEQVPLNQDFVLNWQLAQGITPKAAFFYEEIDDDYQYGLLMVMPPQNNYEEALKKEVIYIIDTSGSMGGVAIRQAKSALNAALNLLNEN